MPFVDDLRRLAQRLKQETFALYLAAHHPLTPWYAKIVIVVVVAYALSPIDLIPDFIPILGHLDDLILLPLGIAFAIRLMPPNVMQECRTEARTMSTAEKPASRTAAAVIVLIWLALAYFGLASAYRAWGPIRTP